MESIILSHSTSYTTSQKGTYRFFLFSFFCWEKSLLLNLGPTISISGGNSYFSSSKLNCYVIKSIIFGISIENCVQGCVVLSLPISSIFSNFYLKRWLEFSSKNERWQKVWKHTSIDAVFNADSEYDRFYHTTV